MEIEKVVKLRTALKAGKEIPLMVYIDNVFRIIDESAIGHFTFWDDTNGLLYDLSYAEILKDKNPTNTKTVSMFCVDYDCIQCILAPMVALSDLNNVFAGIKATGKDISDDRIAMINNFYDKTLDKDTFQLSAEDYNKLLGSNLNTNDDYYAGRMSESFKETVSVNRTNQLNGFTDSDES